MFGTGNDAGGTSGKKRILITSAENRLAEVIATRLAEANNVRLTSTTEVQSTRPFTRSDLDHTGATDELVRGIDAIVHLAHAPVGADGDAQIDYCTRQTYNLLWAAAAQGVEKVVLLSSLELLSAYDDTFEVTEDWRSAPSTDPAQVAVHLGEFSCREFAREAKFNAIVLRLGKVVRAEEVSGKPHDPLWIDERDVAQAVQGALETEFRGDPSSVGRWKVFHVQSDSRRARFTSGRAKGALGFAPQHFGDG